MLEPGRIVDCGDGRRRSDGADAGNGHQPLAGRILTGLCQEQPVQSRDLRRKGGTSSQQCLGRDGQSGIAGGELTRTSIELLPADRPTAPPPAMRPRRGARCLLFPLAG